MSHTDLREQLIDTIDNRRFYKGFPPILYKDIEWLVDNCLLTEFTQQVTAARIEEGDLVVDKMNELNDSAFYSWLNDRQKALHSTLIKDKKHIDRGEGFTHFNPVNLCRCQLPNAKEDTI